MEKEENKLQDSNISRAEEQPTQDAQTSKKKGQQSKTMKYLKITLILIVIAIVALTPVLIHAIRQYKEEQKEYSYAYGDEPDDWRVQVAACIEKNKVKKKRILKCDY